MTVKDISLLGYSSEKFPLVDNYERSVTIKDVKTMLPSRFGDPFTSAFMPLDVWIRTIYFWY
jgi:hypothetical protein